MDLTFTSVIANGTAIGTIQPEVPAATTIQTQSIGGTNPLLWNSPATDRKSVV